VGCSRNAADQGRGEPSGGLSTGLRPDDSHAARWLGFTERREGPTPSRSKGPSQRMATSPRSPLPQQHMETTDLLYLEFLGHREARSQAGRREGRCAESSRDAATADSDCAARMMGRVVRQSAGGALRNATPNLSTLALAPSDDKVSTTAALEPLTLRTLTRPISPKRSCARPGICAYDARFLRLIA
jgi:hypothetical protein